jgi:hypothetical protein
MHNTDKMKKTDLQEIVRQAIQEVINEETFAGIASIDNMKKSKQYSALSSDAKKGAEDELKAKGIVTMEENEIDEMANVSVRYELAPDAAAADFTGKKSRIITAMQATEEPMSKVEVATALGYPKQNPINADFMALVADGVIIPSGEQRAPRLNRPATAAPEAGEEVGDGDGIEGGVAGDMSDEEVEASFAKAMGSGEEEPGEGEIEMANVAAGGMSDEDYEAFMKYTDLENRLSKVKSDVLKAKRARPSIGDIADTPSSELQNLRDLKNRLQTKMDDLLAGSEYLKARQAKLNKKAQPEDAEDTESEEINEWTKNRMQFYAGIKK